MSEIVITPVQPAGAGSRLYLGDGRAKPSGGGGWAVVSRPKRKGGTRWEGQDPYTMSIPCLLDGFREDRSIEADYEFLRRMYRVPTPQTGEPAVVRISGPVPLTQLRWVIQNVSEGSAETRADGQRTRQFLTVDLLEYVAMDVLIEKQATSPAKVAQQRVATGTTPTAPTSTQRIHVAQAGDSLSVIAARLLGNANRWPEIATLNGLRDPNRVNAGQQLRMP